MKRYSHGLSFTTTFTWQNERTNMGAVNNVFDNPTDQWAPSELSEPLITVLAFNYEVPDVGDSGFLRAVLSRLDSWWNPALRKRAADSGSHVAEPAQYARVSEYPHEPCARRAAVPERPQQR